MKTFKKLKYSLAFCFGMAISEGFSQQKTIEIKQKTIYVEYAQKWISYVYFDIKGSVANESYPYVFDIGRTWDEVLPKKNAMVNALKQNSFNGFFGNSVWKQPDFCSQTLFSLQHGPEHYLLIAAKVNNTGNDNEDYIFGSIDWYIDSEGLTETNTIDMDRKIARSPTDKLVGVAYFQCPNNEFISWLQDQTSPNVNVKRNIEFLNDNHIDPTGIDRDVNIYMSCRDFSQTHFYPIKFNPNPPPITLKTSESKCTGSNRTVTITPGGGAGRYEFFVNGPDPNKVDSSPSDPNQCNGVADYLFYGTQTPGPGRSSISLEGGKNYTFRIRDAYEDKAFNVPVTLCGPCDIEYALDNPSITTCNNYTRFTLKAPLLQSTNLLNVQFSIDNITWYNADPKTNQLTFTLPQTNSCRTFWIRTAGCTDVSKVKTICYPDKQTNYKEDCNIMCTNTLAFDNPTITTCGTLTTFTLKAKEVNNLPFAAQFSLDNNTWYDANLPNNQFRVSLKQNKTCRTFWIRPAGCTDTSKQIQSCFSDTDASYTQNCTNTCDVNLAFDTPQITTCEKTTTFNLKVKETTNLPFTAQFSVDNTTFYDADSTGKQQKFTLVQNNSCQKFWVKPAGCPNTSKTIMTCYADTSAKYSQTCSNACTLAIDFDKVSTTSCNYLSTFIIKAKTVANIPFLAQFSLDRETWYNANINQDQFRFTVTKTNECRNIWIRPTNCTDPTKTKAACFSNESTQDDCSASNSNTPNVIILANEKEYLPFSVATAPNPITDILKVDITLLKETPISIKCFNQLGVLVFSKEVNGKIAQNTTTFDTKKYPSGMYLLSIEADNKQLTQKIIKIN